MYRILFAWEFIGPHHLARIRACGQYHEVFARGMSVAGRSKTYEFYGSGESSPDVVVGYKSAAIEDLGFIRRLRAYMLHLWFSKDDVFFLCHYERLEVFLTAAVLRLRGRRVYVMNDSKFDDYERSVYRELLKSIFYLPYSGALVSGRRSRDYLRFLGIKGKVEIGYDTIDVQQTRSSVNEFTPENLPDHFFICVGRLLERKNIDFAIRGFALACAKLDRSVKFIIVGDGPEKPHLEAIIKEENVCDRVLLWGSQSHTRTISMIGRSSGLILVSKSEQWGLVVNEAVSFAIPVIVTDAVGARDSLVRSQVNGFIIEEGNVHGLARAIVNLAENPDNFGTPADMVSAADVRTFSDAVWSLLNK